MQKYNKSYETEQPQEATRGVLNGGEHNLCLNRPSIKTCRLSLPKSEWTSEEEEIFYVNCSLFHLEIFDEIMFDFIAAPFPAPNTHLQRVRVVPFGDHELLGERDLFAVADVGEAALLQVLHEVQVAQTQKSHDIVVCKAQWELTFQGRKACTTEI